MRLPLRYRLWLWWRALFLPRGWFFRCRTCEDTRYFRRVRLSRTYRCKVCHEPTVIPTMKQVLHRHGLQSYDSGQ